MKTLKHILSFVAMASITCLGMAQSPKTKMVTQQPVMKMTTPITGKYHNSRFNRITHRNLGIF